MNLTTGTAIYTAFCNDFKAGQVWLHLWTAGINSQKPRSCSCVQNKMSNIHGHLHCLSQWFALDRPGVHLQTAGVFFLEATQLQLRTQQTEQAQPSMPRSHTTAVAYATNQTGTAIYNTFCNDSEVGQVWSALTDGWNFFSVAMQLQLCTKWTSNGQEHLHQLLQWFRSRTHLESTERRPHNELSNSDVRLRCLSQWFRPRQA